MIRGDGTFVVDRHSERINDTSDETIADGNAHDSAGAFDFVAFLDLGEFAEEDDSDLIFFEVHGDAGYVVRKAEELSGHNFVEAVDAGNAVAKGDDGADFVDRNFRFVVLDLLAELLGYFVCFDLGHKFSCQLSVFSSQ